jgi:uncharacterized membrane protein
MFRKSFLALAAALALMAVDATQAHAWFQFTNQTDQPVYVAFQSYSPSCSGNWETRGWWLLNPGESKIVFGGDLQQVGSTFFYYYAESADGTLVWNGAFPTSVPTSAFVWCLNTSNSDPTTRTVGFREINVGGANNYTLTLTK